MQSTNVAEHEACRARKLQKMKHEECRAVQSPISPTADPIILLCDIPGGTERKTRVRKRDVQIFYRGSHAVLFSVHPEWTLKGLVPLDIGAVV
jgi:hypothetical protein